jgi:hypothetical protein
MLNQPTLEKLEAMRLHGMAQAWREMVKSEQAAEMSFEERAGAAGGPPVHMA